VKEFRIFGPPGTGKTTRLAKQTIPAAVERYGPDGVMVVSFTRAAAREIASRDIEVEPENVGTLHAICYRALGRPEIAEAHIDEWNDFCPMFRLSGESGIVSVDEGIDDPSGNSKTVGDELLARGNIFRARMQNEREKWPNGVRAFFARWDEWKGVTGYIDFTDMIEKGLHDIPRAPGDIGVLIVDEAQDLTPLQFALVRSWGVLMDWIVTVGDDDQTIYSFTGAKAEAFFEPDVPEKYKTVLSQSYRVPRTVFNRATQLIKRVRKREPKEYYPRGIDGVVEDSYCDCLQADVISELAEDIAKRGHTVMVLASCSYMINPTKQYLSMLGIPFQNAYRRRRRDWNPLYLYQNGVTGAQLLQSFLNCGPDKPYWNVFDFVKWSKFILVGDNGLVRGVGKKGIKVLEQAIKDKAQGLHTTREVVSHILSPNALDAALKRDIKWLEKNIAAGKTKPLQYPLRVLDRYGIDGLQDVPKITVGTIHSVKGGEADVVILAPDISNAAFIESMSNSGMDDLIRLFYVGMTRAREKLILLAHSEGSNFIEL